jgi:hypothetical protein
MTRFNLPLELSCNLRNLIRISVTHGVTTFMRYWAGLYPEDTQKLTLKLLRKGAGHSQQALQRADTEAEDEEGPVGGP